MIALVDANSFFCSCEQLFNPKLMGKPMVIITGGKNGCVVSATHDVKKLGVEIGVPYFKIADLCKKHNIQTAQITFQRCSDLSARLMHLLEHLCGDIERYSIDEAFIPLSHKTSESWDIWAYHLKEEVGRLIGLPVSIGIARTKTLAKLASHQAKSREGVFVIEKKDEDKLLAETPVKKVWMVGSSSADFLKSHGIRSAFDLKFYKYPERLYKKSQRFLQIREELWGIHHYDKEFDSGKTLLNSRTFDEPQWRKKEVYRKWAEFIHDSCVRLRKSQRVTQGVSFFAYTSRFGEDKKNIQIDFLLSRASADARSIIKKLQEHLEEIDFEEAPYRKIGIQFWKISKEEDRQLSLFEDSPVLLKREKDLLKALDAIGDRFGQHIVHSASFDSNRKKSKRLTIEDLPKAV